MPKRNTYRPNVEPIHSSDVAIADAMCDNRKAVRKANNVYTRSQGKVNPRPVVLRRPDGTKAAITFKHAEAITARIVTQPRQIGKTVDLSTVTQSAVYKRPGTFYPPLPKDRETVPTPLVVETAPAPVARTRTVSTVVDILHRLSPSHDYQPGLDNLDDLRESKREQGTDI
jgi:hypothetical protein